MNIEPTLPTGADSSAMSAEDRLGVVSIEDLEQQTLEHIKKLAQLSLETSRLSSPREQLGLTEGEYLPD